MGHASWVCIKRLCLPESRFLDIAEGFRRSGIGTRRGRPAKRGAALGGDERWPVWSIGVGPAPDGTGLALLEDHVVPEDGGQFNLGADQSDSRQSQRDQAKGGDQENSTSIFFSFGSTFYGPRLK